MEQITSSEGLLSWSREKVMDLYLMSLIFGRCFADCSAVVRRCRLSVRDCSLGAVRR